MIHDQYILDATGRVIPEPDVVKFMAWFSTADRTVKKDWVDNVCVSTVFIGLNYNYVHGGRPILWETKLFTNRKDLQHKLWRCAGNREQAEAMHARAVQYVRDEIAKWKQV